MLRAAPLNSKPRQIPKRGSHPQRSSQERGQHLCEQRGMMETTIKMETISPVQGLRLHGLGRLPSVLCLGVGLGMGTGRGHGASASGAGRGVQGNLSTDNGRYGGANHSVPSVTGSLSVISDPAASHRHP